MEKRGFRRGRWCRPGIAWCGLAVGWLAAMTAWPALAGAVAPQVALSDGIVAGRADGAGGAVFKGIPFAAPPVGELRWRAPQPVTPWQGVRQALQPPAPCAQNDYQWNTDRAVRSAEDCLYINVHTPSLHPRAPMPVLVWIHGGANRAGSGGDLGTDSLARQGIVVVSLQYRLGVLGFLSLPALSAEQGGHSGNYGLMDQLAALAWVQREIARFGGDPRRVTIAGQSAGAMDAGLLALNAGRRQLFAGVWATGGTPGFGEAPRSLAQNEALGTQMLHRLAIDDLAALRRAPLASLLAVDLKLHDDALTDDSYLWLQAVVDGEAVTRTPAASLAEVPATAVPYVLSTNRIELQVPGGPAQVVRRLGQAFGAHAEEAARYYGVAQGTARPSPDPRDGSVVERIGTDIDFRCAANTVAARYAAHGAPAWRAQFASEIDGKPSHHSAELPYLFDGAPLQAAVPGVSLQAYFVNFIKTGDPNGAGLPAWPRFTPGEGRYVELGPDGVHAGTHLGGPVCDWLDGV